MVLDNILKWLSFLFLGLGVFLAVHNIWQPYSYWWDELYSVTASTVPFDEMFSKFILNDVHPPLYQIVLSFWINIFGTSELATRSLSLAFSLSAILVFSYWNYKNLPLKISTVSVIVFSTSYLFSFYSQETRSFAMMLFFSTLLTITTIKFLTTRENYKYSLILSAIAITLSLTQFFGLIFSGLVLLYLIVLVKNYIFKMIFFFTGLISLIWPTTHFLLGELLSKTGGDFWITSDGVHTTLQTFFWALAPKSMVFSRLLPSSIVASVGVIVLIVLTFLIRKNLHTQDVVGEKTSYKIFAFVSSIVLLFLTVIALTDLHTPISTQRNFIVLLPAFSIFFSYLFLIFYRIKIIHLLLILLFGWFTLKDSYWSLNSKQYPHQNHYAASKYIVDNNLHKTHTFYYRANLKSSMPEILNLMARFYVDKMANAPYEAIPLDPENLSMLDKAQPFIFFSQHTRLDTEKLMSELSEKGFNVSYFEPPQKSKGRVFLIYSK